MPEMRRNFETELLKNLFLVFEFTPFVRVESWPINFWFCINYQISSFLNNCNWSNVGASHSFHALPFFHICSHVSLVRTREHVHGNCFVNEISFYCNK